MDSDSSSPKKLKPLKATGVKPRVREKSSKGPVREVRFDGKKKNQETPGNI
mgnify:CR=1 FL=1|jgi:hypothetical protein